jgi:hypothetical protein
MNGTTVIPNTGRAVAWTGSENPAAYRLVRRGGELLLQARFDTVGLDCNGAVCDFKAEWRDLPVVELP